MLRIMRLALLLLLALPSSPNRVFWIARELRASPPRSEDWPAAHVHEYGLKKWALPQEAAGWSHNYVCPEHGVHLTQKEGRNLCPIDGKDYHGWPVDNVVYMQPALQAILDVVNDVFTMEKSDVLRAAEITQTAF